jgi:hypothetical protein
MKPKLFHNVDDAIAFKDAMPSRFNAKIAHCGVEMIILYNRIDHCTEVVGEKEIIFNDDVVSS